MNKKEYQLMMDSIEPNEKIRNTIYQNINQKSSKKTLYPKLVLACVTIVLAFSLIQKPSKTTSHPFVIEVQAKDGIEEVSADAKKLFTIQNKTFYQETGKKETFKVYGQEGENSFTKLFLTLPIHIEGENIQNISFEVNNPNASLIPRFSLDNYIVGKTDEEVGDAILKYHYNVSETERRFYDWFKKYSEMSEEGKRVFNEYVELYKDKLVNNHSWKAWGNTEEDLYSDEYTSYVWVYIRLYSYEKYDNEYAMNHPESEDSQFLRKLRLDEERYFRWGREKDTKVATYAYDRFVKDDMNMQLSVHSSKCYASTSEMIGELEKTTVKIKVFYNDGTMSKKTISFKEINEKTGTYTLIIE